MVNTLNTPVHHVLNCYLMSVYMSQSFGLQVTEAGTPAGFRVVGTWTWQPLVCSIFFLFFSAYCWFSWHIGKQVSSFSPLSSPMYYWGGAKMLSSPKLINKQTNKNDSLRKSSNDLNRCHFPHPRPVNCIQGVRYTFCLISICQPISGAD